MYDAIIIGSGPGGYVCAIKIAQLGGKSLIVEKEKLGGICTNWGCLPTKALQYSASLIRKLKRTKRLGIKGNFSIDFQAVMQRKDRIVNSSRLGIERLLKNHDVEVVYGHGKIVDKNKVEVCGKVYKAENIVIATGATPALLSDLEVGDRILTSREILSLEKLPRELAIIGGGSIGCEFASIFNAFDVKVSIYEMLPRILPEEDEEINAKIEQIFKREGIKVVTDEKVDVDKLKQEKILIAVGLKPNFDRDEMDKLGINFDKAIIVDECMRTSVENIYATGDVTGKTFLASIAYAQAEVAAMNIMGKRTKISYDTIPQCIFTIPEIASVGTRDGKTALFPYAANGKARTIDETEGFVKVYSDGETLKSCSVIGSNADDLIHEATLCIKNKLKLKNIKETVFAHPTLSEAFIEAVKALDNEALHLS